MIASTGLPDLMIQVTDVDTLNRLQPDMEAVRAITEKHNAVSFHVFAFGNDGHTAHVRDFAPLYGIPEESATGTANAALTHYLQQNGCILAAGDFSFLQGEAMGRPSVVATRVTADGVIYVGGTAEVVAEEGIMATSMIPPNTTAWPSSTCPKIGSARGAGRGRRSSIGLTLYYVHI